MHRTSLLHRQPLYGNGTLAPPVGFPPAAVILQPEVLDLQTANPYRAVPSPGCSPMEERQYRNQRNRVTIGMGYPWPCPFRFFVTTLTRHRCAAESPPGFSITFLDLFPGCKTHFIVLPFFLPLASGRNSAVSGLLCPTILIFTIQVKDTECHTDDSLRRVSSAAI